VLACDLPSPEGFDLGVELDADPPDLGLRHPVQPKSLQQVVDVERNRISKVRIEKIPAAAPVKA